MPLNPSLTPTLFGNRTQGPAFSLVQGDPVSMGMQGGSDLLNWLPQRGVNAWNDVIKHIDSVAAEGFTGEKTYYQFLASQNPVGECDFGPGAEFQVFEYYQSLGRISFSNKNRPLNFQHYGMQRWQTEPRQIVRGYADENQFFTNDADWIVALLSEVREQHLNWVAVHGDAAVPSGNGMFDGLDTVISRGYVLARRRGGGSSNFIDPVLINGASLDTAEKVAKAIQSACRTLLYRMFTRGYLPAFGDMVVVMNPIQWAYVAQAIAGGSLMGLLSTGVTPYITPEAWQNEYGRVTEGGFGYGFIPVDSRPIPVIVDPNLGHNVALPDNKFGVIGDIYVLNRRFRGVNILEHVYLDWNLLAPEPASSTHTIMQNGSVRVSWSQENNVCYWYGLESWHAIVTRMQPLQAKIKGVTIVTDSANEFEAPSFTSPDWYAGSSQGGKNQVTWRGYGA